MKTISIFLMTFAIISTASASKNKTQIVSYKIVDTGQTEYFNNSTKIKEPKAGDTFFGQDAHFQENSPSYTENGDGTITDNVTGLIWQKGYEVMSYNQALEKVKSFKLANRTDWRLPSIKEAYSLILFSGIDVSSKDMSTLPDKTKAFIDTKYFDFKYASNGPRVIDTQLLSSTIYQGTTMGKTATVFGVNLADGRIKGYPLIGREGEKLYTVRFVCGNTAYGKNIFQDNKNGTISDVATGLMWEQTDSKKGLNWEDALAWAAQKNAEKYLGYSDWRLPSIKELQSIVDYSRSPQKTNSAAIDPLFFTSKITDEGGKSNYPFFWSSTTHEGQRGGDTADYMCFGEALGFMGSPRSSEKTLMDVHGAGAQRSDPKSGDASRFPSGRGPQGDVIRINNYVRLVRNIQ